MTSETSINFNESAFDHSKPTLAESMGIDLDKVDELYHEKVLPLVRERDKFRKPRGLPMSVVVESILKADIPQKERVFMLVGLKEAVGR